MLLLPETRGCVSANLHSYCCGHPFKSTDVPKQRRSCSASRLLQRSEPARLCTCRVHNRPEVNAAGGSNPDDMMSAFSREIANRNEAQERAAEQGEASSFGGRQLLEVLQARYGRSYDVALVQRKYLGKVIIAFNVMWKYKEQVSFGVSILSRVNLTEAQYMERLDEAAAALRAWGKVKYVKEQIAASKNGPRVGRAVSVILDLDDETIKEWFLIS